MKSNAEFLQDFIKRASVSELVHADEIPSIPLYMDQITTFMNENLAAYKRYEDDKIMTKTMINNYAKNDLIPAPEKKKYSKDHMILLLFIYYFKSFLSITDIQTLITPITEQFFQANDGMDLAEFYETIISLEAGAREDMLSDLFKHLDRAETIFEDAPNKSELQRFAFICMISYDIYMKKMLLERMVDEIHREQQGTDKKARK